MFIEKWKILVVSIFSLLLVSVFFLNLKPNEFLSLHDELLVLNYQDAVNGLFVRNVNELNVDNTTILTVTLIDRLYYFFGFLFKIDLQTLQKFFYFVKLLTLILIPYIGFKKFAETLNAERESKIDDYTLWLITFLYAFNTYTIIYWHGNAFQFSLLICYALAPLALYYFKLIINSPAPGVRLLMKEALIFMLMGFSVYFFAVFLIVLLTYYFAVLAVNPRIIKTSPLNLSKLAILSLPLFAIFLPMIQILIFGGGTVNATGGETFTNLRGGLLYQIFLWFSWGIYSDWSPKNIFTFSHYYRSVIYLLSPLVIFGTIFYGIKNKISHKDVIYFLIILIVTLTLVKGSQPPFQEIYVQLMKHFPPFRVFRSPDNKFGFGVMLSLCFLLLLISQNIKKKFFVGIMLFVIMIQSFPLFSGIAIKGQNTEMSSDRIIHIPDDYSELVSYLSGKTSNSGYLMPIPPISFGHFILSPTEKNLGQDIVIKLIKTPYVTPDQYSSMSLNTYKKIQNVIKEDLDGINALPIEYFLIRRDLEFLTYETELNLEDKQDMVKVFENPTFTLFQNQRATKIIEAENAKSTTFEVLSPVEYVVHLDGVSDNTSLVMKTNFSNQWKLYLGQLSDSGNIPVYPNFGHRHLNIPNSLNDGYSNEWTINKSDILRNYPADFYETNDDGTINIDLTIYYQPQTTFYIVSVVTVIFALIYATFIIVIHDE